MKYLLDTNVIVEITAKPRPNPQVVAWFQSTPRSSRYLSVLTVAEIATGVGEAVDQGRRLRYATILGDLRQEFQRRIKFVEEFEAATYLALHKRLKSVGTIIDAPDALIAATAIANRWTLVSRNTKHLGRTGAVVLNPWEFVGGRN